MCETFPSLITFFFDVAKYFSRDEVSFSSHKSEKMSPVTPLIFVFAQVFLAKGKDIVMFATFNCFSVSLPSLYSLLSLFYLL